MNQVSEIIVYWTPQTSGRVISMQIQSRIVGTSQWTEQAAAADPTAGEFRFQSNAPATDVEVRSRYRMIDGVFGAWKSDHLITQPAVVQYGEVAGTPTSLGDVNPTEGTKLDGIAPGADVTGDNVSKDTNAVGGTPAATIKKDLFDARKVADDVTKAFNDVIPVITQAQKDFDDRADAAEKDIGDIKVNYTSLVERVDSIETNGGYDDTTLKTEVSDVKNAYLAADKALGERVDTVSASAVSGGGNLLSNTDFNTLDGWNVTGNGVNATMDRNAAGALWQAGSENNLSLFQDGRVANAGDYIEVMSDPFTVTPNSFIQFYVFGASHRANNWVSIFYYRADGSFAVYAGENMAPRVNNGGRDPSGWDQNGQKYSKVPGDAVSARMVLRKYNTLAGEANSYAWFWRPYVSIAREGQTSWNPYSSGNSKAVQIATDASIKTTSDALATSNTAYAKRSDAIEASVRKTNTSSFPVNMKNPAQWTNNETVEDAAGFAADDPRFIVNGEQIPVFVTNAGENTVLATVTTIKPIAGHTYRATWKVRKFVGATSGNNFMYPAFTVRKVDGSIGYPGYNKNGADLSGSVANYDSIIVEWIAEPDFSWIRPRLHLNHESAPGVRYMVSGLVVDDITDIAASNARIKAVEKVTTDGTFAAASRVNTIEATVGAVSNSVVRNDTFNSWPDGQPYPSNWAAWATNGNFRTERLAPGRGGGQYCVRTLNDHAEVDSGFVQDIYTAGAGKWIVEVTVNSDGSGLRGTGVTLSGVWNLDFLSDPDVNGRVGDSTGEVRSWSKMFDLDGRDQISVHAMHGWSGFGRGMAAKYMVWHRLSLRPATAGEILAGKVDNDLNKPGGVFARITTTESAITDLPKNYATAKRATDLEASVNGPTGALAKISALETVTSNGTFAAASTVSTLRSDYDKTASTVTTQASTIAGKQDKTGAFWKVTADSGNGVASVTVGADGYGAGVVIEGDVRIGGGLLVDGTINSGKFAPSSVQQIAYMTTGYDISIPRGGTAPGNPGDPPPYDPDYPIP